MSLSASMWSGVSGLLTHGDRMNVIGNNLANVNTVGFKGQRMDFADLMYHDAFSLSGPTQIGNGVRVGAVLGDFAQGATESSTDATDLAISGNGFFKVSPVGSDASYYTRAGNFRFDNDGYLVDPNGYAVQGWKTNASGTAQGAITDVKLEKWSVDPSQTTKVSVEANLKSTATSKSYIAADGNNPAQPFSSLANTWNGANEKKEYLAEGNYGYQTSLDVYDEAGGKHTLTVYFDKIDTNTFNGIDGNKDNMWEYIVTMNPEEDLREIATGANPQDVRSIQGTRAAGLLMAGTLTFDSNGRLKNQSAYTLQGGDRDNNTQGAFALKGQDANGNDVYVPVIAQADLDGNNVANSFFPTSVSDSGYPELVANFTGVPNAQTTGSSAGSKYKIEMDFGLKLNNTNPWGDPQQAQGPVNTPLYGANGPIAAQADAPGTLEDETIGYFASNLASGVPDTVKPQTNLCTSYDDDYYTQSASQNGYGYGTLSNYSVGTDGVLSGIYSNGETLPLYQLSLYDFTSKQGLRRDGNNLFSQTRESGEPAIGVAGTGRFGSVNSYSLEGSNVDIATEFVRMITTQRGFQSNSKMVTTTDTMLETVINMKRM